MLRKHHSDEGIADTSLVRRVNGLLARHGLKLILAESMTGGAVAAALSAEEHAGEFLLGSIVCYSDELKIASLGISRNLLEQYGGVSAEVTTALVDGLQNNYPPANVWVAITGFAFDSPACNSENPVGTVYIHLRLGPLEVTEKYILEGSAYAIVEKTVTLVLLLLEDKVHQLEE